MKAKKMELASMGIVNSGNIFRNLSVPELVQEALKRKEGVLSQNGALCVETGRYTGRSPEDRFIVKCSKNDDEICWGDVNKPISEEKFTSIYNRLTAYLQNRDLFVFDGFAGADKNYGIGIRVINELAHQCLFIQQLLVRPTKKEMANYNPDFTVICAPGFNCIPEIDGVNSEAAIIINFSKKIVLIIASRYCGEIKKSIFSVMNHLLPAKSVLPMHCSANTDSDDNVALFFGLSGTGKTTLSADPERLLIGDDEHGWSEEGVFNFEGGCYAKTIKLSQENEPQIWSAIKFGTLLENVKLDTLTRIPDFDDASLTENTRAGYPIEYIPNAVIAGKGEIPKTVVFLTADAFGVLPPIAKLTKEQAMYHFLSGYTSKLAGTERGITAPEATFSACFGEPFLPRNPFVYADMLGEKIEKNKVNVFLINTGWVGGPYGIGERITIKYTRAMVSAALKGQLDEVQYSAHPIFKINIPHECPGVSAEILNPINMWSNKEEYDIQAKKLAQKFRENFSKFSNVPLEITAVGPEE